MRTVFEYNLRLDYSNFILCHAKNRYGSKGANKIIFIPVLSDPVLKKREGFFDYLTGAHICMKSMVRAHLIFHATGVTAALLLSQLA